MPRAYYGAVASNAGLAHWIGWRLRGGVENLGNEFDYLHRRSKTASAAERTAWLYRALVSSVLVVAEYIFLYRFLDRRDSLIALGSSWLILAILPRPVPRLSLLAARALVFVTTIASLSIALDQLGQAWPAIDSWKGMVWFFCMAVLLVWVFIPLQPRGNRTVQATGSSQPAAEVLASSWSNVPAFGFERVGGAASLKNEIRSGAENRFKSKSAPIVRNGILLHGPQGTGKNLLAEAIAGEYRVNFHHVRCPELIGINIGSTSIEIRRVFEWAAANRPIVLFLDEIDSIGSRKQAQGTGTDAGGGGREYNTVTTQLMQSIDRYRNLDGLLLVAATNFLDGLEPTLVRDGRFDARLRLDLPNEEARKEILTAILRGVRSEVANMAQVARRTPGWSPARLKSLVDRATLLAEGKPVSDRHLIEALETSGGADRPAQETVDWNDVILPAAVVEDLRNLLRLLDPGTAERLSIPPPTGLILIGEPGTGKTLTARLIATQSKRSFYSIAPSDILSGAVGGSVKRLSEVFLRARENAPSILLFDEMDSLFPNALGALGHHDVQLVEQALIEISALRPEHNVFLMGTTNNHSRIDPRILRGGRFGEKIEIGLPDEQGYRELIRRFLTETRIGSSLSENYIFQRLYGMTPADVKATITAVKRLAMRRMEPTETVLPPIEAADLDLAIERVRGQ